MQTITSYRKIIIIDKLEKNTQENEKNKVIEITRTETG